MRLVTIDSPMPHSPVLLASESLALSTKILETELVDEPRDDPGDDLPLSGSVQRSGTNPSWNSANAPDFDSSKKETRRIAASIL